MSITMRPVAGTSAAHNPLPPAQAEAVLDLPGTIQQQNRNLMLNHATLSHHSLFLGGTGSGKTNLMFRMVDQLRKKMTANDVMIIFDSKGDYYKKFNKPSDLVIGNSTEYAARSQRWNIFQEILADGEAFEQFSVNAKEIAGILFAEQKAKTTNVFFPNAAEDVLSSLLVSICLDAQRDRSVEALKNNEDFSMFLQGSSPELLAEQLSAHEPLRSAASYIQAGSEQSLGVISEVYTMVRRLFMGVFAKKGVFSMRQFIRQRAGKVLFLEYDLSIGNVLTPLYRLLIDLALKEALGQNRTDGNIYLIFDEFKLLPHLQHIDDAVNFGRSKGVKVFAGLQSIEQLYDIYGQSRGRSVAAGFGSVYAFRVNDEASMRYARGLYGANLMNIRTVATNNQISEQIQTGFVIEDRMLAALHPGEAVVCLPFTPPFIFQFKYFV